MYDRLQVLVTQNLIGRNGILRMEGHPVTD